MVGVNARDNWEDVLYGHYLNCELLQKEPIDYPIFAFKQGESGRPSGNVCYCYV